MLVHPNGKCHSLGLKGFGKDSPLYSYRMGDHGAGRSISIRELIAEEQRPSLPPNHPHCSPIQYPSRTNPSPHGRPYPGKTLRQEPARLLSRPDNTLNPSTASRTSPFHRCWQALRVGGHLCSWREAGRGKRGGWLLAGGLGAVVWPWGQRWGRGITGAQHPPACLGQGGWLSSAQPH